jgi:hypothetical protein
LLKVGLVSLQTRDRFTSLGDVCFVLSLELIEASYKLLVLRLGLVGTLASSG